MQAIHGRAVLFGYEPVAVVAEIEPRPRSWRLSGAARSLGIGVLLAPIVAVVPPHAPWAIGALAVGAVLGRRRWIETHTLMAVEGACPKCGGPLTVKPQRLRRPHPLECEACHHTSALELPAEAL
ncbi:MAG: hypothetical protein U5R14_06830 [Gemmatimonadota bacterium]|nr:hypothetical protein [Gemmatimonadota bacterium]